MTLDEFVADFGHFLSPRILKECFNALAVNGVLTEEVTAAHGEKLRNQPKENFLVSKGAFMIAILEAHRATVRRSLVKLHEQFTQNGAETLDEAHLGQLFKVYDPSVSDEIVTKLYAFGSENSAGSPADVGGYEATGVNYPAGVLHADPLHVPELLYLFDPHVFEFDLETGSKVTVTKTTKTITTRTTRVIKKA